MIPLSNVPEIRENSIPLKTAQPSNGAMFLPVSRSCSTRQTAARSRVAVGNPARTLATYERQVRRAGLLYPRHGQSRHRRKVVVAVARECCASESRMCEVSRRRIAFVEAFIFCLSLCRRRPVCTKLPRNLLLRVSKAPPQGATLSSVVTSDRVPGGRRYSATPFHLDKVAWQGTTDRPEEK